MEEIIITPIRYLSFEEASNEIAGLISEFGYLSIADIAEKTSINFDMIEKVIYSGF